MITIINGPNLNMLGQRDARFYGNASLADIERDLRGAFPDVDLHFLQSNHEGDIIDAIQACGRDECCRGLVINPGAFAHYSYAIADALTDCPKPAVEVHLSNIAARDEFRRVSVTAACCRGCISGLGAEGYRLAVSYLIRDVIGGE